MKNKILALILVCLAFPSLSMAQQDPQKAILLVDQYIGLFNNTAEAGPIGEVARKRYSSSVAAQIATLEPQDFNVFMMYLLSDRYLGRPSERKAVADLLSAIPASIKGDIETADVLKRGAWWEYSSPGWEATAKTVAIVSIAFLPWSRILSAPLSGTRFLEGIRSIDQTARNMTLVQFPYRFATNRLVITSAAGVGLQYLSYEFAQTRTYRANPLPLLQVLQEGMACDLSYLALKLEKESKQRPQDPGLRERIENALAESQELMQQNGTLASLIVNNKKVSDSTAQFSSTDMVRNLREKLNAAGEPRDGVCPQVSLWDVKAILEHSLEQLPLPLKDKLPPFMEKKP